jgi:hypothetical protein
MIWNSGDEGHAWLEGLASTLKYLFYGSNNFEYDGIPPIIGKLTNLIEYDCSFCLYHDGPLRGDVLAPLVNMEYMVLGGNNYSSTIPSQLYDMPNLMFVYLGQSKLKGDLDGIERMPKIGKLNPIVWLC